MMRDQIEAYVAEAENEYRGVAPVVELRVRSPMIEKRRPPLRADSRGDPR